jgi:hypothetical protein
MEYWLGENAVERTRNSQPRRARERWKARSAFGHSLDRFRLRVKVQKDEKSRRWAGFA